LHARAGDVLARAGGDEFTLIVDGAHNHAQAQATAERLLFVCDQPFHLDRLETSMSVTVGACLLADAASVEEAIRNADLAMYAAKTAKRGSTRLFEPSMREQAVSRVTTEHHLRRAIANSELCQRNLVPPSAICLELTETALMADPGGRSSDTLDQLRAVGVELALDDFGTGYSSLARLSQLQLSAVKIDRSFIHRMLSDPTAAAVVDAVMRMAEPMGVAVIAEGIETADELAKVADLGCPYAQGYLFSRPLEPHDARRLLNTAQQRSRAV
jgi:predicted signal transduction protein with EAL and GGDEF domain